MKNSRLSKSVLCLASILALSTVSVASAASIDVRGHPGYVDLGSFAPAASGGEFVEINLGKTLLALAATVTAREDPEVSELLKGIHAVRVNVVTLDDVNRDELLARAEDIGARLAAQSWEKIVTVHDQKENVNMFMRTGEDGTIQGLTVVVFDAKKEAVFINVVGNIRPEQLATVAKTFDIEPLRHLRQNGRDRTES